MNSCATPTATSPLSYKSIITLLIFAWISLCTIRPIRISYKKDITIDFSSGALIGFIALLLTQCIGTQEIISGIVGDDDIQPYSILILFFSLSYVCVSLDITEIFALIAQSTAERSESKMRLFWYFYIMNSILTLFTSNDVVILTITPIILYYTQVMRLDCVPIIFGEFIAANTWSVALVIGNPTNVIVATAEKFSFLEYSAWMIGPTCVSALCCVGILYMRYRRVISSMLNNSDDDYVDNHMERVEMPHHSWVSARLGLIILGGCLLSLVACSFSQIPLWVPSLVAGVLSLIKDIVMDISCRVSNEMYNTLNSGKDDDHVIEMNNNKKTTSNTVLALSRMPWKIAPFVIIMFILVEALDSTGWLPRLSTLLVSTVRDKSPIEVSLIMALLSSLFCIVLNNQPMTILFTRVLFSDEFSCVVSDEQRRASLLALIFGSNLGAMLSVNASLAGLMLTSILEVKGVKSLTGFKFSKEGFITTLPAIVLGSIVLGAEIEVMKKK